MGVYRFFRNKADKIIAITTLTGIMLIELFSKDLHTFQSLCNDYSPIIIINALSWLYTSYRNVKKSLAAKMFLTVNTLFLLSAALNAYSAISGRGAGLKTSFLDGFLFATIAIILCFNEIMNRESQLQSVSSNYHSAYQAAITDEMTGLYNRAYMVDMIHKARPPYSIVMLDIDDFKEINDSCGHRFGDTVICHIAVNLKKHVRSDDLVFRYGGDEFFMILYECPAEKAREIVTRIKQWLATDCLKYGEKPITATLSCGIYFVEKEEKQESIFDKVDAALYHSKKNGKNDITVYNQMQARLRD
jgi:diguanylate cyclase (GGDEF) domain